MQSESLSGRGESGESKCVLALICLIYFRFLSKDVVWLLFLDSQSAANNEFRFGYLHLKSADMYLQTFQLLHLALDQVLADQHFVLSTHNCDNNPWVLASQGLELNGCDVSGDVTTHYYSLLMCLHVLLQAVQWYLLVFLCLSWQITVHSTRITESFMWEGIS